MKATIATLAPMLANAFKTPEYYATRGFIAFRPSVRLRSPVAFTEQELSGNLPLTPDR
jgi:hypothetical protein